MHPEHKSTPRILQQQPPARDSATQQQQQQGSTDFQSKPGGQVEGEGSYTATRNYQKDIADYLDNADVQADAEASRPRSAEEAREIEQAEREGKSHSKGER